MAKKRINPTRMELNRLKGKHVTAVRGHKLLKDKRDELMRQFLELIRQNKELREKVEEGLRISAQNFALARSTMQDPVLDTALLAPSQEVTIEASERNVMSVMVPVFDIKTRSADASNIYSYGLSFTSGDLDSAVKSLDDVLPDMLQLAEIEKSCQLMADEIEKTRRRVNALEYTIIPDLETNIKYIQMKLEEHERSNQARLMKVKDMMLEDTYRYEERARTRAAEAAEPTVRSELEL